MTASRYAYVLEPPADDLVHALKYEGWPEVAHLMGDALAKLDLPDPRGARTIVVPVPTTRRRLESRGYNQAQLLASHFARARDLPIYDALVRTGEGRSQTALTPAERRENVRGAFVPAHGAGRPISGAEVLLVDDVLTTGATASEAAMALAAIGAVTVTLITFARALPST